MLSLYHAYQAYERRAARGELERIPASHRSALRSPRLALAFRAGGLLIRAGLKHDHPARAGHALPLTAKAER